MIKGSCLCGGVRFEIDKAAGPFELCHCSRCRKVSASAFLPAIGVLARDFRMLSGAGLIATYEAPILREPPAYRSSFCSRCGSQVPNPPPGAEWLEVPAGLLDDDPKLRPDKHIFVEYNTPWHEIADRIPQFDVPALRAHRKKNPRPGSAPD
jgi:hypothetical protein